MSRLIIGHTTHNSTKIWIRGDRRFPYGFVTLESNGKKTVKKLVLEERHFYTGIATFKSLIPKSNYSVSVSFSDEANTPEVHRVCYGDCTGKLKTFPKPSSNDEVRFIFGSCNLHSLGIISNPDKAYERILDLSVENDVHFMLHCGDQIYYDIPNYRKAPDVGEYREKYLDAWGDSRRTRKFLTQLPHYMILDDHEITNDFANDMDSRRTGSAPEAFRDAALKVYREFQDIRNPQDYGNQALYYKYEVGKAKFFVLDTRSERYEHDGEMIGSEQMEHFLAWLKKNKDNVKFVVTSIPFVFQVKHAKDKWCGAAYLKQREEILEFILKHKIEGITFLTGDMHASGHAKMEIKQDSTSITIHELMSSPINQLGKSSLKDFESHTSFHPSQNEKFSYRSSFKKSEFFDQNSNITVVTLNGRDIKFDIQRTKKKKRCLPPKSFTV